MNFIEAMKESQKTGLAFMRPGSGWFRYYPGWTYKLQLEDIFAEDYKLLVPATSPDKR